jgi:predicted hydrocarbon binding protein
MLDVTDRPSLRLPSGTRASAPPRVGSFHGTGVVGTVEHFLRKYGPAAGHAVVTKLKPEHREYVRPNTAFLGLLGARKYPYPFVGDLVRSMMLVVHATDEEAFLREVTSNGMELTLSTVGRMVLRYGVKPHDIADRAQELWSMFHDSGRVTLVSKTPNEYVTEVADWPSHDGTVCQMCVEARRYLVAKTGVRVTDARRVRCQAWGHESCHFRVRWA